MKKFASVLLVLVMLLGLCVGALAAVDPEDPSTWPVIMLNQPEKLECVEDGKGFLDGDGEHTGYFRFAPWVSGIYVFEVISPNGVPEDPFIMVFTSTQIIASGTRISVYLDGLSVYHIGCAVKANEQPESVLQLLVQKQSALTLNWWESLPSFLIFLLRWFAFGWLWMG